MYPALFKEQPQKSDKTCVSILEPLKHGKCVVLKVSDDRLPKKSRVVDTPVLLLAPSSVYGGAPGKLVCSLQAYGCEIVDTTKKIPMIALYRLGLAATLASALTQALNDIFHGGKNHGNKSQRTTRKTRRASGSTGT